MSRILRTIEDYLEYPDKANLLKFCLDYKELSEIFWDSVDQDDLKIIENSLNQVMVNILMGNTPKRFEGFTDSEIKDHFNRMKINLIDSLPESTVIRIKKRLNELLLKNLAYARRLDMKAPINEELTAEDYYNNYLKVESSIPSLQYVVDRRKNKKGGK